MRVRCNGVDCDLCHRCGYHDRYYSCSVCFFFSSRRRHTRFDCDWSSDVCSSDLAAVRWLEPHMERVEGQEKGTIVLATVRGDVHDIGKNLVDIILTNNGYRVINLGIKQPIGAILQAANEHKAHAVGMSGLLVKSTVVMRENLEEMSRQGLTLPVMLGGAALTRPHVGEGCGKAQSLV